MLKLLHNATQHKSTFKLIVGDFNYPEIDWANFRYNSSCDNFMNIILDLCLVQHVLEPTRENHILDLILSQSPETVANVNLLEPLKTSDHQMVLCELNLGLTPYNTHNLKTGHTESSLSNLNYKKGDWSAFLSLLAQVDWDNLFVTDSVDDLSHDFLNIVTNICRQCFPKKMHHPGKKGFWETKYVRDLRAKRNKAERNYLASKSSTTKRIRNQTSKDLKKAIKSAVLDFETSLANNREVKPFWHYVKSKYKTKASIGPLVKDCSGSLTEDAEDCANTLSKFYSTVFTHENKDEIPFAVPATTDELVDITFTDELVLRNLAKMKNFSSPGPDGLPYYVLKAGSSVLVPVLCKLFQFCFDKGTIPTQWKLAHVVPIYKKGNRNNAANYRPVSLTCCSSKLMESCVRKLVWEFWSERSLITSSQFGFRQASSSSLLLLQFLDDLTLALDNCFVVDAIYLDFSKVFNSVPHERLISKLSSLGIKGKTLRWIRAFLTNRKEVVVVDGACSKPADMVSGVPQGSCLGPILFLAYINDIDSCFLNSSVLKYADDIKCYRAFPKNDHNSYLLLQNDLDSLSQWSSTWQLHFNLTKCTSIHFGHGNKQH